MATSIVVRSFTADEALGSAAAGSDDDDEEIGPLIEVTRAQRKAQYLEENKHLKLHQRWWNEFVAQFYRFFAYIRPTKRRVIFYLRTSFPIVETVITYPRHWREYLMGDLIAGVSIVTLLIPQVMSYATVAGLPVVYGLYSSFVPMAMYLALGSCHQLNVAPVAVLSLLVNTSVSNIVPFEQDPERYVQLAVFLAMLTGVWQLGFGMLNIGFLLRLLSPAFINAFVCASAFTIGSTQLGNLFGYSVTTTSVFWQAIVNLLQKIGLTQWLAPTIGVPCIAIVVLCRRNFPRIPVAFCVIVLGILTSWLIYTFNDKYPNWPIVGSVPAGLPSFAIPTVSSSDAAALIGPSIVCTFIGYMESYSLAIKMGDKHNYVVRGNQEFIALGAANLVGSFFSSYPVTGSFSRTAEADQQGARTILYTLVCIISVIISLLFLTPVFKFIPKSILSTVVIAAVYRLVDFEPPIRYWYTSMPDFFIWTITFLGVIFGGSENGLAIGAGFEIILIFYQIMFPYVIYLGEARGRNGVKKYLNVERFPQAKANPDILMIRFDGSIQFLNSEYFSSLVHRRTTPSDDPDDVDAPAQAPKVVVFDGSAIARIDYFGAMALLSTVRKLRARGISPLFAYLRSHVKDVLIDSGFIDEIGLQNIHHHVEDAAVDAYHILAHGPRPAPAPATGANNDNNNDDNAMPMSDVRSPNREDDSDADVPKQEEEQDVQQAPELHSTSSSSAKRRSANADSTTTDSS